MEICLIRHGRTEANKLRLYCGSTDVPLSDEGVAELEALSRENEYPPATGKKVYTSGMARTEGTLNALYGDIEHAVLPCMREMAFGEFEMHSYDELKENGDYIDWITDTTGEYVCPGGESSAMFKKRVFAALDGLVLKNKDAIVICHGGVIAEIMARTFPDEGFNFYEWQPKAGRGYVISYQDGKSVGYKRIT